MRSARFSLIFGLNIFSVVALAQAAVDPSQKQAPANNYVMCKNQKNVRTIRVENEKDENLCVTFYTKAGVDREVGRAQSRASCEKIVENIRKNLEKANWKCRDLEKVTTTTYNNHSKE
jgi:hypothetical protein